MVRKIPEEIPMESGIMPDMQGTIEGTLFKEREDTKLIGKWADQLGRGDFSVFIGNTSHDREKAEVARTFFQGEKR